MQQLAGKIVDGLLDPDDMEKFLHGAVSSSFGQFMRQTHFAKHNDGMGGDRDVFYRELESDDGLIKIVLNVTIAPELDNKSFQVWFHINTKLLRWEGNFDNWDMRIRSIKPEEISTVAQEYFSWLTDSVPVMINNRRGDLEMEKAIPTRLKYLLSGVLWQFDRRGA